MQPANFQEHADHPVPAHRASVEWLLVGVLLLGVGLKLVLLFTSQSMPDADEAVEGIMARHILEQGVHPLYPYGVNYGAGGGWEAHLAAGMYACCGQSAAALKSVGLFHWLLTLILTAALAHAWAGRQAGLVAAALFAAAPQSAQWSLKVAGGHQVAVVLALVVLLLCVRRKLVPVALVLAPLAVLAHPIVLPFVVASLIYLFVRAGNIRSFVDWAAILVVATMVEYFLLQPPARTVWNPVADSFDLLARLVAIPRLAIGLFTPNLNAMSLASNWQTAVGVLWLAALVVGVFKWRSLAPCVVGLAAPWAILALVAVTELAPRHLLIASPIAAAVLAAAFPLTSRANLAVLATLTISGLAIQVLETRDPSIYGPDLQSEGVVRANVEEVVAELQARGVHHVYSLDPMIQWNLMFASNEEVLARWIDGVDRVPAYPAQIDAARRAGQPIAVVYPVEGTNPRRFAILFDPPAELIDKNFQTAPAPEQ